MKKIVLVALMGLCSVSFSFGEGLSDCVKIVYKKLTVLKTVLVIVSKRKITEQIKLLLLPELILLPKIAI